MKSGNDHIGDPAVCCRMKSRAAGRMTFCCRIKGRAVGSMTVEASFIMLFTLGVIVAILYCGVYFHDRCLLAGNGYEAAVWGAWQQRMGADTDGGSVAAFAQNRGLKKNWFYKTVDYEADVSRTSVTVSARAQNALPGISVLQKLLAGGNWKDAAGAGCTCIKKEAMIRRSRVLKELLEDGHD